ncbi:UNVERIFIED_CONTAM: hypothetical protein Sangu_3119300 [Sesamum angustifolium]|uniref:Reverse transcriptase n=1 Tax=Sesamum angustifolium TaxID=2727405 RepID=A0AAW2K0I7_9LAMI
MEWLRESDRNTKFFHARASSRCKKNEISRLKGEDGVFVKKKEDTQNIITAYFSNLFKSTKPHKESIEEVLRHVQPKVTTLINQTLMQPFIAEEVTRALEQMGPVKSPGPDESQSAFVSNRLVTDNILVSFEVNHYLKNKRGGKECFAALKLDMSKAYDRVEWSFLKAMLDKLGFDKSVREIKRRTISANMREVVAPIIGMEGAVLVTSKQDCSCEIGYAGYAYARKGWNSSFSWQSIVSTIPLIERGSRWKVGDGSKIRIWKDRWLPCGSSFKVYSPPRILDENARAAKLIHNDGRSWKENLVHGLFPTELVG